MLLAPMPLAAQPAPRGTPAAAQPETPKQGARSELPPLPPEYLQHDQAGIRFAYHPSARDRVRPLIEMAESVRSRLRQELDAPVLAHAEVRVGMGPADVARITPGAAGTAGRPSGGLELVIIDLGTPPGAEPPDAREAFCRALAHLALDELAAGHALPHWLHEGFALRFANRPSIGGTFGLGWAALRRKLVPLNEIDRALRTAEGDDSLAASQTADFVRFLLDGERGARFPELVGQLARGTGTAAAISAAYGTELGQVERSWRADLAKRAVFVPLLGVGIASAGLLAAVAALGRRAHARRMARRQSMAALRQLGQRAARPAPELKVHVIRIRGSDLEGRVPTPDMPLGEPPSEGVPKVSHDGRWHTLH